MWRALIYGGLILLLIVGIFIGKGEFNSVSENVCEEKCVEKLENAKTIEIIKDPADFKKEYIVVVDNEVVAKLKGKAFKLFGDVYSLYDGNGENPILIEKGRKSFKSKNGKMKFDLAGELKTADGDIAGYITEEFFSWGTKIHLFDADKEEIGMIKGEVMTLTSKFEILDSDNKVAYSMKKAFSFTENKYNVKVNDVSEISVYQAVMLAVAADEEND